jgi:hypothetical protein
MKNALEKVFEGQKVRFLPRDEEVLVPLPDIARALDYDKKALWQIIDRNSEFFATCVVVTTIPSEGGSQKTICLNRDGVVGLLMKLATGRIKDPIKRQMIVGFQRWAIRTISEITQGIYIGKGDLGSVMAGTIQMIGEEVRGQGQILLAMQKQMELLTQAVTTMVNQAARAQYTLPVPQIGAGDDFKLVMDIKRQQNKNGRRVGYKAERLGQTDQIAELLRMGYTYDEVAEFLKERGMSIGKSSVQRFAKRRLFGQDEPGVLV